MSNEINGKISYPFAGSEKELNISGSMAVEDGKLNGVLTGSVEKDATGRVDRFNLTLNDLPFDGAGGSGGSNVEIVNIAIGEPEDPSYPIPVLNVDKTWSELEAAVLAGKTIIAKCSGTLVGKTTRTSDLESFILQALYDDTNLLYLNGENNYFESGYTDSVLLNHFVLNWNSSDALPTVSTESIELQLHGGN